MGTSWHMNIQGFQQPDGVNWRCIRVGMEISIEDEVDPQVGLTSSWINDALPFIRVP